MREILDFFKDIFMIKEDKSLRIGLTSFRENAVTSADMSATVIKKNKDLKLSDLMRGNC